MKKWVNAYAPMFNIQGVKIATIPEKSVVISHEYVDDFRGVPREAVSYVTDAKQFNGYVYVGYLEPYIENYPTKCVEIKSGTPSLSDAEQYAVIHGVRQTELCGELCAAYLLDISLEDLLAEWERETPTVYQRVFNWFTTKKARGTGPAELQSMLSAFEKTSAPLSEVLMDKAIGRLRYTVSGLQQIAGRAIVSVHIDKYSGRLKPSGILHWVVVTAVLPERTGYGGVEVYNPFPNRIEVYPWAEFVISAGVPYGVVLNG